MGLALNHPAIRLGFSHGNKPSITWGSPMTMEIPILLKDTSTTLKNSPIPWIPQGLCLVRSSATCSLARTFNMP